MIVITLSANSLLCNASSVSCVNNSLWMFDNKFVVLLWDACKFETFDLRAWHTDVFEVPKCVIESNDVARQRVPDV